jgi:probable HAF family extracellular repeat protein
MQSLGFFGTAKSVNNHTDIVGHLSSPTHAFLWKDGSLKDLGTLYGGVSAAADINDLGVVVGQASAHAFVWSEVGGMKDLGTLNDNGDGTADAAGITTKVRSLAPHMLSTPARRMRPTTPERA